MEKSAIARESRNKRKWQPLIVMAGLVPAIHAAGPLALPKTTLKLRGSLRREAAARRRG
jgi:hypothetical protein